MNGLQPRVTRTSQPYWDGLEHGVIMIQHCLQCDRWIFYPRVLCPYCGSRETEWLQVDGSGAVYTFTVAEIPVSPPFADMSRLVIAIVEIEHNIRLPTNIVDVNPDLVSIGMKVSPVFDKKRYPGITMLYFEPTII